MARQRDTARTIRCAIYSRKSTEEGLEQSFNSLHAQREACAAYVLSQRHEGWILTPDYYDDGGGYSGGTMDRPALKALLGEVAASRIALVRSLEQSTPRPLLQRLLQSPSRWWRSIHASPQSVRCSLHSRQRRSPSCEGCR